MILLQEGIGVCTKQRGREGPVVGLRGELGQGLNVRYLYSTTGYSVYVWTKNDLNKKDLALFFLSVVVFLRQCTGDFRETPLHDSSFK